MKIRKPGHTTVVAYLALFAALGGTAFAARDEFGAKEIKQLNVRQKKQTVQPGTTQTDFQVVVRCKQNEQFIAGGGGWVTGASGPERATVRSAVALQKSANGPPKGYIVAGSNPVGTSNTLVAQALCLPR